MRSSSPLENTKLHRIRSGVRGTTRRRRPSCALEMRRGPTRCQEVTVSAPRRTTEYNGQNRRRSAVKKNWTRYTTSTAEVPSSDGQHRATGEQVRDAGPDRVKTQTPLYRNGKTPCSRAVHRPTGEPNKVCKNIQRSRYDGASQAVKGAIKVKNDRRNGGRNLLSITRISHENGSSR